MIARALGVAVGLALYTVALVILALLADPEEDEPRPADPRINTWPAQRWEA